MTSATNFSGMDLSTETQTDQKDEYIEALQKELGRMNELYTEACKALGEAQVSSRLSNGLIMRLQEEIQELQKRVGQPPEQSDSSMPVLVPEPVPANTKAN